MSTLCQSLAAENYSFFSSLASPSLSRMKSSSVIISTETTRTASIYKMWIWFIFHTGVLLVSFGSSLVILRSSWLVWSLRTILSWLRLSLESYFVLVGGGPRWFINTNSSLEYGDLRAESRAWKNSLFLFINHHLCIHSKESRSTKTGT